jgi:fructose-1,6-bisphosphatase II / sedoheptulose-1,7-bisphosphatase
LEGTTSCAKGEQNAVTVVAMAERGGILAAPDIYMDKIAVGPGLPEGVVDLDKSPLENLQSLSAAKGVGIPDLLVCILDRPRHEDLITKVRDAGARIMLIGDGDVSGAIATALPQTGIDMYLGIGGAPEGVLAAAALGCVGGQMEGRLVFRNDSERALAKRCGIVDLNRKYAVADMASGDVMVAITGITDGPLLRGVRRWQNGATSHSLVLRSKTGTIRCIETYHNSGWMAGAA